MRLISAELRFRSLLVSDAGWRRGCQMVSELVTGLRVWVEALPESSFVFSSCLHNASLHRCIFRLNAGVLPSDGHCVYTPFSHCMQAKCFFF